jgi:hypothetical protein
MLQFDFTGDQSYSANDTRGFTGKSVISSGDFMTTVNTNNGQLLTVLSVDPLTDDHESVLYYNTISLREAHISAALSISQRARGQYFSMEVVSTEPSVDAPVPIAISAISQTATTLTITLASRTDIQRNEWFDISGCVDVRFNYSNLNTLSVSYDGLTITATTADEATIPSITATPSAAGSYFTRQKRAIKQNNGSAIRFSGTATLAAMLVAANRSNIRSTGTIGGSQAVTIGTTAPSISSDGTGQLQFLETNIYEMQISRDKVTILDWAPDSAQAISTVRQVFDTFVPDSGINYNTQFRSTVPKSVSRPIAKIISASKAGATTTTITTDVPHGLQTGQYVDIIGIRDQVNFVATTAISVTVTGTNTFTVAIAGVYTGTSYGGMVVIRNGAYPMTGMSSQSVQSIAIDTYGVVTLTGNAAWTSITIGEYVNLYGLRDNTSGADLGFDGAYQVINITTTTMKLVAVKNLMGVIPVNGNVVPVTPTLTTLGTTNCGGAVFMRTTLRLHDVKAISYNTMHALIDGQGELNPEKALPVYLVVTGTVISSLPVGLGTTTSGNIMYSLVGTATTNAVNIASAKCLYTIEMSNPTAAAVWVKLFNKASAPTVGTDIPVLRYLVPAGGFRDIQVANYYGNGFTTGVSMAITANSADSDTTAVAAGVVVNVTYK